MNSTNGKPSAETMYAVRSESGSFVGQWNNLCQAESEARVWARRHGQDATVRTGYSGQVIYSTTTR
jgi:hypothetical protein